MGHVSVFVFIIVFVFVSVLALVEEQILYQEVGGGDVAATVLQMLYHVREANAVFLTKVIDCLLNKTICIFFLRILTTTTKVTALGSRWTKGLHYSISSSKKVEAITILETEKSYVNILLGDYDVPEVPVDPVVAVLFQNTSNFSGFPPQVLSLQFCPVLPWPSFHEQAL